MPLPKTRRKNQDELTAAAAMSESFHGRAPRIVTEYGIETAERDTLANLGRLLSMTVLTLDEEQVLIEFTGTELACSPDGGQLYLMGGDQAIDLDELNLSQNLPKDRIVVGAIEVIVYRTRKGFHNFEPTDYEHEFGEEGGELPMLNYDTLNRTLFLTGGSYQVRPEGIVN